MGTVMGTEPWVGWALNEVQNEVEFAVWNKPQR